MMPFIASLGLATSQGNAARLASGSPLLPPTPLPWPAPAWAASRLVHPAYGVDPALRGAERWRRLARLALEECFGAAPPPAELPPLVVASCNGAAPDFSGEEWRRAFSSEDLLADTAWAGSRLPIVSAACASGLHGLYLARLLLDAGHEEVVLLAVDILSPSSQGNFESLKILAAHHKPPWQAESQGFLCGEAAVALRLRREGPGLPFKGPFLSQDLCGEEGLGAALARLEVEETDLILGQGTGPDEVDRAELAALRRILPLEIPLTSTLYHFGHTLGASSLLGPALASLPAPARLSLCLGEERAIDGRRLFTGDGSANPSRGAATLVACRALGGACAAMRLGGSTAQLRATESGSEAGGRSWLAPAASQSYHPQLRRLAEEARRRRPPAPPGLLLLRLEEPLAPPARALFKDRLLPSAVLDITPGRAAAEIARAWGFSGPTLCLVGDAPADWPSGSPAGPAQDTYVVYMNPAKDRIEWD